MLWTNYGARAVNTKIEKNLDRKSQPRYIGPFEVIKRTYGGLYQIKELDGTVCLQPIAAFRLIPYLAQSPEVLQQLAQRQHHFAEA